MGPGVASMIMRNELSPCLNSFGTYKGSKVIYNSNVVIFT
jgi:hypothetical protein